MNSFELSLHLCKDDVKRSHWPIMTDVEKEIGNGLNIKKSCVTFNLTMWQQLNEADCLLALTDQIERTWIIIYIVPLHLYSVSSLAVKLASWRISPWVPNLPYKTSWNRAKIVVDILILIVFSLNQIVRGRKSWPPWTHVNKHFSYCKNWITENRHELIQTLILIKKQTNKTTTTTTSTTTNKRNILLLRLQSLFLTF